MLRFTYLVLFSVFLQSCKQELEIIPIALDRKIEWEASIQQTLEQSGERAYAAGRFAFNGNYQAILAAKQHKVKPTPSMSEEAFTALTAGYALVDADEHILAAAEQHDIVMFNEDHNLPLHRHYIKRLLRGLYERGYRYLALEAIGMLGNGEMFDTAMMRRGYPIKYSGHYMGEPEMGCLVREAIVVGFTIFGYDEGSHYGYGGGDREERGADNIIRQMGKHDWDGKLLVLCGWDHIKEGHAGTYWDYALAERLKKKTGKDPLTINQTQYEERLERQYEDSLYQQLSPGTASVLLDERGRALDITKDSNWYDLFVFHPRTVFEDGLPKWLANEAGTQELDLSAVPITGPVKLLLFDQADDANQATPLFLTEVQTPASPIAIPRRHTTAWKAIITNGTQHFQVTEK